MTAYKNTPDTELLQLLHSSDAQAFEELYNRYWEELYKTAFIVLRDVENAKDIVQEIFIWIWKNRVELRIQCLKGYLRTATKYKVANYIRNGKVSQSFLDHLSLYNNHNSEISAEEKAEIADLQQILQMAISQLPEKCRTIFLMSRQGHFTNNEIADRLGISIKTVENQMTIALRRIRAALETYPLHIFFIIFY